MLLDKSVLISNKYNYNLDYYKSIGYDISRDFFVSIEHLLKNSSALVNVSCDYCGFIEKISYYKWNRSMKSSVKKYSCKSCKGKKIKESNLLRYGVTSVAKLKSSKDKAKKTNIEKYGVEFHTQSELVKNKIKESNLNTFGVENPMQLDVIKDKQRKTLFNLYGVSNISKLEQIKDRKKETSLTNFGVNHPLKSEKVKSKIRLTNFSKYGNIYFTKTEVYRKENYDIANDEFYLNYIDDGVSLFKCDYKMNHSFEITKDIYSKRKLYNIGLCTVCNPIGENRSVKEKELLNFISSIYLDKIINNYRDGKMEIDVYLPNLKIGFEFNGLYWHSDIYKDNSFHLKKTTYFKEMGIRIIHIWEDDWDFKKDIIKSQIRNWLGLTENKIFARRCEVKEIENKDVKDFLNRNHILGNSNSLIKIGLFHGNHLVSLMTFDKFEGRKKMKEGEWNLSRFCNVLNTNVTGGASKLFKYFILKYKPSRVVSYADKDWSDGELYYNLGFKLTNINTPDYKYIIDNKRIHKSRFRKSKTNITESKLEIPRIWDCGKLKFEFILDTTP